MPRFVFGPSGEALERGDVAITLIAIERGGVVRFSVGGADPEFSQPLQGLHVVYLTEKPAPEQVAEEVFRIAKVIGSATAADLADGGDVTVHVPDVPPGRHWVQSILEYAE
jgi:hypothetical protein